MDDALRPPVTHGTPSRDAFQYSLAFFQYFGFFFRGYAADGFMHIAVTGDFMASGMDGFHLGSVFFRNDSRYKEGGFNIMGVQHIQTPFQTFAGTVLAPGIIRESNGGTFGGSPGHAQVFCVKIKCDHDSNPGAAGPGYGRSVCPAVYFI